MRRTAILSMAVAAIAAAAGAVSCGGRGGVEKRAIRVGSKNFSEQVLLGEIVAQALEARADSTSGSDAADLLLEASELARAAGNDARSITLFDSSGMGLQDVAAAVAIYRCALEAGAGTRLTIN